MSHDSDAGARKASGPGMAAMLAEQVDLARRLRHMRIRFHEELCLGCLECYEVCPAGCWAPSAVADDSRARAVFVNPERCIACGACVLQCPEEAIELV